jgi:hypothetical protein
MKTRCLRCDGESDVRTVEQWPGIVTGVHRHDLWCWTCGMRWSVRDGRAFVRQENVWTAVPEGCLFVAGSVPEVEAYNGNDETRVTGGI